MTKLRIVLSLVVILALLGCSGQGDSGKTKFGVFDGLTGGEKSLDNISSAVLNNGDEAWSMYGQAMYRHVYDSSCDLPPSPPDIVIPHDRPQRGRWLLTPPKPAEALRAQKPRVNDPANYGKNGKPDLTSPGQRRAVE
jgi:hypothetical protein